MKMRKHVVRLETIIEVPEEDLESVESKASSSSSPTISGSTDTLKSTSACNLNSSSDEMMYSSVSSSEWNAYYPPWSRYQPKSPRHFRNRGNQGDKPSSKKENQGLTILRVKNLRDDITNQEIRKIFKVYGEIDSVSIYYDVFDRSTGTADVIFLMRKFANDAVDAIKRCVNIGGEKNLRARIIRRKRRVASTKN